MWVYRFTVVKMSILFKLICNPNRCFGEISKLIPKFKQRYKEPGMPNTTLKKKSKTERPTISDFKTYYKTTVFKSMGLE